MKSIQQIYCTHCTYGSSAIEKRQGELADRTLGYSARAGSLPAEELRRFYRYVERDLYYHLPVDTPAQLKLDLDADTAPRRMIFQPSSNGVQFLAHICYRQKDTADRPGSYFGHALVGPLDEKKKDAAWLTLDCLRQWGAPQWATADSSGEISRLSEYDSIRKWAKSPAADPTEMLDRELPLIGQSSVLTLFGLEYDFSDVTDDSEDDGSLIPARFKSVDTKQRRKLLTDALKRFLEIATQDKHSLLLVAEPGLATLLYYAILRLVPRQVLRQPIGFSTFEPSHNRVSTTLAATCFHDPARDIPPEVYRSGHAVVSTVAPFRTTPLRNAESGYADLVISRLFKGGWEAVDALHRDFVKSGATTLKHLEELAAAQKLVPQLLKPTTTKQAAIPRDASDVTINYLRRAIVRELESDGAASIRPEDIQGTPRHLIILRLLAIEKAHKGAKATIKQLLKSLPDDEVAELLSYKDVAQPYKLARLRQYVQQNEKWPPKLPLQPMLLALLKAEAIDQHDVEALYESLRSDRKMAVEFLGVLAQSGPGDASDHVLRNAVKKATDPELIDWLDGPLGKHLTAGGSPCRADVVGRLSRFVNKLASDPERFEKTLKILQANEQSLDAKSQARVFAWSTIHSTLTDIGKVFGTAGGSKRGKSTPAVDVNLKERVSALAAKAQAAEPLKNTMGNAIQRSDDAMRLILPVAESLHGPGTEAVACRNYIQRAVLADVIGQSKDAELADHLSSDEGRKLLDSYPKDEPILQRKLSAMLDALLDDPPTFHTRMGALVAARHKGHLSKVAIKVDAWKQVDAELLALNSLCKDHANLIINDDIAAIASKIHGHASLCATAFANVLPSSNLKDVRVKPLIVHIAGVKELANVKVFWQTFQSQLEKAAKAVTTPATSRIRTSKSRSARKGSQVSWGFWSGIVIMMTIGAGLVWHFAFNDAPSKQPVNAATNDTGADSGNAKQPAKINPGDRFDDGTDNEVQKKADQDAKKKMGQDDKNKLINSDLEDLHDRVDSLGWKLYVAFDKKLIVVKGQVDKIDVKKKTRLKELAGYRKELVEQIEQYYSSLLVATASQEGNCATSFLAKEIMVEDPHKPPKKLIDWAIASVANLDILGRASEGKKKKYGRLRALLRYHTQAVLKAHLAERYGEKNFAEMMRDYKALEEINQLTQFDMYARSLLKRHGFSDEHLAAYSLMAIYTPALKAVLLSESESGPAKGSVVDTKGDAKPKGGDTTPLVGDTSKKQVPANLVDGSTTLPDVMSAAKSEPLSLGPGRKWGFKKEVTYTLKLHAIDFSSQDAFETRRSLQKTYPLKAEQGKEAQTLVYRFQKNKEWEDLAVFMLKGQSLRFEWKGVKAKAPMDEAGKFALDARKWLSDAVLEIRGEFTDGRSVKYFALRPPARIEKRYPYNNSPGSLYTFIARELKARAELGKSSPEWDAIESHLKHPDGIQLGYGHIRRKTDLKKPLLFVVSESEIRNGGRLFSLRIGIGTNEKDWSHAYANVASLAWKADAGGLKPPTLSFSAPPAPRSEKKSLNDKNEHEVALLLREGDVSMTFVRSVAIGPGEQINVPVLHVGDMRSYPSWLRQKPASRAAGKDGKNEKASPAKKN